MMDRPEIYLEFSYGKYLDSDNFERYVKILRVGGLRKRGKEETSDHWQSVLELSNLRGPTIRETNSVTNLTNAHTSTENKFPYS
jgi:hypothetical protein